MGTRDREDTDSKIRKQAKQLFDHIKSINAEINRSVDCLVVQTEEEKKLVVERIANLRQCYEVGKNLLIEVREAVNPCNEVTNLDRDTKVEYLKMLSDLNVGVGQWRNSDLWNSGFRNAYGRNAYLDFKRRLLDTCARVSVWSGHKMETIRSRSELFKKKVCALMDTSKGAFNKDWGGTGVSFCDWVEYAKSEAEWAVNRDIINQAEVHLTRKGTALSLALLHMMYFLNKTDEGKEKIEVLRSSLKGESEKGENSNAFRMIVTLLELDNPNLRMVAEWKMDPLSGSEMNREFHGGSKLDLFLLRIVAEILHLDYVLKYRGLPYPRSRTLLVGAFMSFIAVIEQCEEDLDEMENSISKPKEIRTFFHLVEDEKREKEMKLSLGDFWRTITKSAVDEDQQGNLEFLFELG